MSAVGQEDSPAPGMLLPGFEYRRIDVGDVTINCAVTGTGPPLLLLHGYPQNHFIWRDVAPALAEDHTVVVADLRGYGDSDKPAPDAEGVVYSKRSMARDQVEVMRQFGFGQFQLVSHDRGARAAHRLVLDHPGAVTRLAILDILPTRYILHNVTQAVAAANYQWFFLATDIGIPEHMIGADPGFWVRAFIGQHLGEGKSVEPEAMEDYVRCFRDPRTVSASCGDWRSALGIDLAHDDETFAAGQRVECPVLVLWGTQSLGGSDPLGVWREYAPDVRDSALPCGHFLPEEAPDLVVTALRDFLD
jgi:haloacetate dehalogenase